MARYEVFVSKDDFKFNADGSVTTTTADIREKIDWALSRGPAVRHYGAPGVIAAG